MKERERDGRRGKEREREREGEREKEREKERGKKSARIVHENVTLHPTIAFNRDVEIEQMIYSV